MNGWEDSGPAARPWGIGNPGWLYLNQFGRVIHEAFGVYPFLVGSALREKVNPRDVDVRLVLPMRQYLAEVGTAAECGKSFTKWAALSMAFSALGREMTGLPIDFQIQTTGRANTYEAFQRRRIGIDWEASPDAGDEAPQ
jgi:hypothetical protein